MASNPRKALIGNVDRVRQKLLRWYRRNRRDLPWRETRDPYPILVSEVMLQQTQVATVIPYYRRFLERFSTLKDLAEASEESVLTAWSGLGYYRRARNLRAAAREVMARHDGTLPKDPAKLRVLPGVGAYTAGAVASIAFEMPEPALDGNGLRVLSRFLSRRGDPKLAKNRKVLERTARELLQKGSPGDINQALMELGARVCLPANPRCPRCPLRQECLARRKGKQHCLPETRANRSLVEVQAAVAIIHRGKSILMTRRGHEGLLEGLWELPGGFLAPDEEPRRGLIRIGRERLGVNLLPLEKMTTVHHTLTYRRVQLEAYRAVLSEPLPPIPRGGGRENPVRWIGGDRLANLPHGAATRKVLERIGRKPRSQGERNLRGRRSRA